MNSDLRDLLGLVVGWFSSGDDGGLLMVERAAGRWALS